MNDGAANDATGQPVTLANEATPDAAAPTATAAATIAPDAHFPSPGIKLDTELFSKRNIKNMADKEKIDTTYAPDAPNADNPDAATKDDGSTESNSPYSSRNHKLTPYSTNTTENQKKKEKKIDDKVTISTPPDPNAPRADTPNDFSQDDGSNE